MYQADGKKKWERVVKNPINNGKICGKLGTHIVNPRKFGLNVPYNNCKLTRTNNKEVMVCDCKMSKKYCPENCSYNSKITISDCSQKCSYCVDKNISNKDSDPNNCRTLNLGNCEENLNCKLVIGKRAGYLFPKDKFLKNKFKQCYKSPLDNTCGNQFNLQNLPTQGLYGGQACNPIDTTNVLNFNEKIENCNNGAWPTNKHCCYGNFEVKQDCQLVEDESECRNGFIWKNKRILKNPSKCGIKCPSNYDQFVKTSETCIEEFAKIRNKCNIC